MPHPLGRLTAVPVSPTGQKALKRFRSLLATACVVVVAGGVSGCATGAPRGRSRQAPVAQDSVLRRVAAIQAAQAASDSLLKRELADLRTDLKSLREDLIALRTDFGSRITAAPEDMRARPELIASIAFADGLDHMLLRPLVYRVGNSYSSITVPAGFVTDLASIPRIAWTILPPMSSYTSATVVHDWLYWTQDCTRKQADNLLLIGMAESEVNSIARGAIFAAVRARGGKAWANNKREKARGSVRVLPENARAIPTLPWPVYRKNLAARGVKNDGYDHVPPAVCALGNDTAIPR